MRVKLTFEDPLPPYRCWYEIPASCSTVYDLQKAIRKGFELNKVCKTTRLDLDGFFLLPASSIAGSIKEGDLLQVMIRKKNDHLPPRSLPAVGGKRPREESEPTLVPAGKRRRKCRNQNRPKQMAQTSTQRQTEKQPSAGKQSNKNTGANAVTRSNNLDAKKSGSKQNNSGVKAKTTDTTKSAQKQKSGQASKKSNDSVKMTSVTTSGQAKKGGNPTAKEQAQKNGQEPKKGLKPLSKPTKQDGVKVTVAKAPKVVAQAAKESTNISSSSSSDSSDSDSSDSDSSDSDSSDSDSSDSSDSDSSKSSSDDEGSTHESDTTEVFANEDIQGEQSDSDSESDAAGASTKVPPGTGSLQTKLRNNRRKLQRKKEVLARMDEAFKDGKDTGCTPVNGSASESSKQRPPSQATQHQNVATPSPVAAKPSPKTSKVVMTTIELEDKDLMSKKRNTAPVQRVTRSSSKGRNTDSEKSTPVANTDKEVKEAKKVTINGQKEDADFDAPLRDYDGLPKLEALSLEIGNVIGYKTLELGADYNPIISDFKEAKVLKLFQGECSAEVQLARRFRTPVMLDEEGQPVLGKFDIYNEEEFERAKRGIVLLDLLSLADCRIVAKK